MLFTIIIKTSNLIMKVGQLGTAMVEKYQMLGTMIYLSELNSKSLKCILMSILMLGTNFILYRESNRDIKYSEIYRRTKVNIKNYSKGLLKLRFKLTKRWVNGIKTKHEANFKITNNNFKI